MIPLFRPDVPKADAADPYYALSRATGRLTNFGPCHDLLSIRLNERLGGYWLPVSNGTVAIHAALSLLPSGSTIALPDFTFAASALGIYQSGHGGLIIPCRYKTAFMDLNVLEEEADRYDAILAVSPFGYEVPMQELETLAADLGKLVIWDFAAAYPMKSERSVCTYSLHAAKTFGIGEGGLIRFPKDLGYKMAKRRVCFDFDDEKECLSPFGFNGKMDELRCAMALAQLDREVPLLARAERHKKLINQYQRELPECDAMTLHENGYPPLCVLRGLPATEIVAEGKKRGIVFRQYYHPLISDHLGFRAWARTDSESDVDLDSYLALPSDVTATEFEKVVQCVQEVCRRPKAGAV